MQGSGSRYDRATALVVVDLQNDFADPSGSLYVREGEVVIPIANAEGAGSLIVYTQDWHPESTPHFEKDGGLWPVHCVHDTWGAMFHPDLRVIGDVVRKGTGGEDGYSAFSVRDPLSGETAPTILPGLLADRGIERVVLCGLATDFCVVEARVVAEKLASSHGANRRSVR